MSTATRTDLTLPLLGGRNHFLLRRLHSLTGLLFGGYIIVHLLVNATLVQGVTGFNNVYQLQVNKIHELPFLLGVEWVLIFVPIIFHTVYGIWIIFTGQPNVAQYPYGKNYFYLAQRISAAIIVAFLLFHVLGMRGWFGSALAFDHADAARTAIRHINASWFVAYVIYPIGILASCYHLANGFWTAAITWGLTVSSGSQRRWGLMCIGIFVFTLVCGYLALGASIAHRSIVVH